MQHGYVASCLENDDAELVVSVYNCYAQLCAQLIVADLRDLEIAMQDCLALHPQDGRVDDRLREESKSG